MRPDNGFARFDGLMRVTTNLEVLGPAAVATMNHQLTWTDATGTAGEFNGAWTAVFRLLRGQWKVAYAYKSTPRPEAQ
jgi:hypothetical protein